MADNRTLKISIFRYNPNIPGDKPRMQEYELQEMPHMTIFMALNKIREEHDPTLQFDFVCRGGICGSCGMMINGKVKLGCKTMTKDLPKKIKLMPMPTFKLIGDLSVDTGTFFRDMNIKTESWVHTEKKYDPKAQEERMDNEIALKIYEADRCIECGVCIACCETVNIHPEFLGAATINRVARFMIDPRDERTPAQYFDIIGNEEGTFGCVGLMACDDLCPQEIPLQMQLAFVRRKSLLAGLGLSKSK
ncbi:MAG: fumarate reductase [Candidatus Schekmanbacteria bacterium RBG_16_38_11]|uniref:Fumarate reductase iron-sulfur subunit n=2 Tax=Candidatus Schekmaniibacteriota TaxID=1817811 RepID=A0A1F7RUT6_9BACT